MRTVWIALTLTLAALAADPTGQWKARFDTQIGPQSYTYDFKVNGKDLTGQATNGDDKPTPILEGRLNGDRLTFVENFQYSGMTIRIEYIGKIEGDKILFTRKVAEFAVEDFTATRAKP